jgi:hypothetical protein
MPIIHLPARCDRAAAEALLPELQAALGSGPLQIDASATSRSGRPCCRCCSAPAAPAKARRSPSPALRDTARLAGLEVALFDRSEA